MSATLDENLVTIFKNPFIFTIEAPIYPIDIHYLPNQPSLLNQSLEIKIRNALNEIPSNFDVLIFLPGMREILSVQSYLGDRYGKTAILHSEISKTEQDLAIKPISERKIILATNIAESSITIPGIRAVIDSGIQREAIYSPWNGLKTIEDRPTTKASAIQRAGRAGRTQPGVAYRLYSKQDYEAREDFQVPEIFKADLTEGYLVSKQLRTDFLWPATPPEERWQKAKNLSYLLGFTDEDENLSSLMERSEIYPVDKKISRVLIEGENTSREEKKKLLQFICETLEKDSSGRLKQRLQFYLNNEGNKLIPWEKCLLAGFIDQVAKYRIKQNDFIHFSGKLIKPHASIRNLDEGYYLVLDITQRQEAILVVPIEEEWLFEHTPFPFRDEVVMSCSPHFSMKSMTKLGSILIDETNSPLSLENLNQEKKNKISESAKNIFGKKWLEWKESESFNRYHLWKKINGDEEVSAPDFWDYIEFNGELNWDGLEDYFKFLTLDQELNEKLPFTINLSGRKSLKVFYPYNQNPYLEAPIQDFYGLKETPTLYQKKIVLILRLIGPHKRPLQVTSDLAGFWNKTYLEMIKELKRDYPRHHWPDDPQNAKPLLLKRHLDES
jgi:ATP-dependent helicase HrpB